MSQVVQIQFADKMLSFDTFIAAIRNVVKEEVCKAVGKKPFISKRQAYNTYGRKIDRWIDKGFVHEKWRYNKEGKPTRCDIPVAELEACAYNIQDLVQPSSSRHNLLH